MHATIGAVVQPVPVEKHRTITLTNRAPVRIIENEWPIIAHGGWADEQMGGLESVSAQIRVRRNKFGMTIIHANFDYYNEHEETGEMVRVGRILDRYTAERDLNEHILAVGEEMNARLDNKVFQKYVLHAVDRCFASLPPEAK